MNGYPEKPADYDVIIIGSGISGINSAHRVQTQCPAGTTYTILEARNDLGGTWSFFKYPGLRSDSDLHTFGFSWRPWRENKAIATADLIIKYVKDCAAETGIDKKIRYNHKVLAAEWSSETLKWTLTVDVNGQQSTISGRWIILGTGYYDYDEPMKSTIPGLENFKGKVIHPQFWPEDLDYTGKKMVIIGSGATAVTMLPIVADKTAHVTMLQRSPSYIMSLPSRDVIGKFWHAILPESWAAKIDRIRFMLVSYGFFYFCRSFPNAAKKILAKVTKAQLPDTIPLDPHFKPSYNPWEQRLCLCPDGDFYAALRKGKADIVTDTIKTVTEKGILLSSGDTLQTDIIVTATGLKIHLAGGVHFSVDGKPIVPGDKFMWKGVMLQDLPNVAFVIGYTNASWTLGAEATAQMVTRLITYMKTNGYSAAVPRLEDPASMPSTPMLNLNSTYIQNALSQMPKSGANGQWVPRSNYFSDYREATKGDIITDLQFYREGLPGAFVKKSGS